MRENVKLIDRVVGMVLETDPRGYLLQMTKKSYEELMWDYVSEFGSDLEEMGMTANKQSLEEYLNIKIVIGKDAGEDGFRLLQKK